MTDPLTKGEYNDYIRLWLGSGGHLTLKNFVLTRTKSERMAELCCKQWRAVRDSYITEKIYLLKNELAMLILQKKKCYEDLTDSNLTKLGKLEKLIREKRSEIKAFGKDNPKGNKAKGLDEEEDNDDGLTEKKQKSL